MNKKLFTPFSIGNLSIKNRLIRAATYEGMADEYGNPTESIYKMYDQLASNDIGLIITGFNYTSIEGRAMQPNICGMDDDSKIDQWKDVVENVHQHGSKIVMQITHAGRQTLSKVTGHKIYSPSKVKCTYFRETPHALTEEKIHQIIEEYAEASVRIKKTGMDGVQIHCAHGYLVHQFFSPHTNRRTDKWGGKIENRFRFARAIYERTRELCGDDFAIIVKISCGDDRGLELNDVIEFCKMMEETGAVDAIEISYGAMEYAINIFRGKVPLHLAIKHNPMLCNYPSPIKWLWKNIYFPLFYKNKIIPFSENYNLEAAESIAKEVKIPIILTGGVRRKSAMEKILNGKIKAISSSRIFLREPDILEKMKTHQEYKSHCVNCNACVMMCDSRYPTKCYLRK